MSTESSPPYVRRSLTLPQEGPGPPGITSGTSLSPNHIFLQQHLPPTFPHTGNSPEGQTLETSSLHPMVVLTPTTQEWRELREIRRLEGEDLESENGSDESDDSDNEGGRSFSQDHRSASLSGSEPTSRPSSLLLRIDSPSSTGFSQFAKPQLREFHSADYLGQELRHTPDPGSGADHQEDGSESPERPIFKPIIIAPSPVMQAKEQVAVSPESPTKTAVEQATNETFAQDDDAVFGFELPSYGNATLKEDSPVRFASIGRRESLHIITKPEIRPSIPRAKTKRELERERLFKDLDENIEAEGIEPKDPWNGGVQQIGMGGGLGSRPNTADAVMEGRTSGHSYNIGKTSSMPAGSKPVQQSPAQTFRPSPLHASPLTVTDGLPTPVTPSMDMHSAPQSPKHSPSFGQASQLASLRDFARTLVSPHPPHSREKTRPPTRSPSGPSTRPSTPSPPLSARSSRIRDNSRVSLVAGRVVQPFAIPSSTALPPDRVPLEKPSLQSFSAFESPSHGSGQFKSTPFPFPTFNRLDSTISLAPSIGAPSECGTPTSETAGGAGGRGIDDYVILKEAGKGAYGLVMRARVKGPKGEPVGVSHCGQIQYMHLVC